VSPRYLRRREFDRAKRRGYGGARLGGCTSTSGGTRSRRRRASDTCAFGVKVLACLAEQPESVSRARGDAAPVGERARRETSMRARCTSRNLRRKTERDASKPERLVTVRGIGYKLIRHEPRPRPPPRAHRRAARNSCRRRCETAVGGTRGSRSEAGAIGTIAGETLSGFSIERGRIRRGARGGRAPPSA